MRKLIKNKFTLFGKCGKTLVLFELIYKALAVAMFYPLFLSLFELTLKSSGIKYLINGYIPRYFANPVTILSAVLMILVIAVYNFYDKCCLTVLLDAAHNGERLALFSMFYGGSVLFLKKVRKRNLTMFFYEIFLFPFSNIICFGLILTNLSLPEQVIKAFGNRNGLYVFLTVLCIFMFVSAIRWIFATDCLLFGEGSSKEAYKESVALIRKRVFKTVFAVLFWNIVVGLFVGLIFLLITGIVIGGVFILDITHAGIALYLTVIKTAKTIITITLILISVPASYMITTRMFLAYRKDDGIEVKPLEITEKLIKKPVKCSRLTYAAVSLLTVASLVMICVYSFMYTKRNPFDRVEFLQIPDITAHRGSSGVCPENTMAAFSRAVDDMADYVELDVHLTVDGVVVVMHDSSLKRTTGLRQNVWKTSYDTIKRLDAGSWFSDKYAGEPVPTLEEVIKNIGDDVKLNIEIKYNKNERQLTEKVVDIIERYEYADRCIITSSDYTVLSEVKRRNGNIRTGYVVTAAYGAYYTIGYVDVISISYTYVNKAIVDAIHNAGKEVYVWTVNSPSTVRSLVNMGVDNIITDNPVMAREVVYSQYVAGELVNILNYVFTGNGY